MSDAVSSHQRPRPGDLCLDHVGHFVTDLDAAANALEALGFVVTPRSDQSTRDPAGAVVPAGTANRCVMLDEGYLEILAPTADTDNAQRMRALMARYPGIHILALGTPSANEEYARLKRHGFSPLDTVHLQRDIELDGTPHTARFGVQRVPTDRMPEGRVQFCEQKTPECLWQARWLGHANGVRGLQACFVSAEDPEEAGARYAEFAAALPGRRGRFVELRFARGAVYIGRADDCRAVLGAGPKAPGLAGYALVCDSPDALAERVRRAGGTATRVEADLYVVQLPAALGSQWLTGSRAALAAWAG